jgi:polyisoprenoid-binding protein YceI
MTHSRPRLFVALAALALAITTGSAAFADTLVVDPNHSSVSFLIRHFVTKLRGEFNEFAGTVQMDEAKPENSSVDFTIQAKSIDTRNPSRDADLRSPNFFAVDQYPTITFKSTKVTRTDGDSWSVTGNLTMRGVTKEITLPVEYLGRTKDGRGNLKAGFETATTLNRQDYGISWNAPADNGLMLGDDVRVEISLEVTAPRPPAAK